MAISGIGELLEEQIKLGVEIPLEIYKKVYELIQDYHGIVYHQGFINGISFLKTCEGIS